MPQRRRRIVAVIAQLLRVDKAHLLLLLLLLWLLLLLRRRRRPTLVHVQAVHPSRRIVKIERGVVRVVIVRGAEAIGPDHRRTALRLDGARRRRVAVPAAVEQFVPANAVPVVDRARSDAADIGALADEREAPLVLAQTIGLGERAERRAASGLAVRGLEGIDLLEEVEIALVAALEGLIRLFPAKYLHRALRGVGAAQRRLMRHAPRGDRSFWWRGGRSSGPPGRGP